MDLPYWFCSIDCYKNEIRKKIDRRYDFNCEAEDDIGYIERIQKAREEYYASMSLFRNPFSVEAKYVQAEINKAVAEFKNKKVQGIMAAEDQLHKRLAAEWKYEQEQEAAALEKEQAKQHELAKKEAERQRKIDEEEAAREAEEEKWQPKKFDI